MSEMKILPVSIVRTIVLILSNGIGPFSFNISISRSNSIIPKMISRHTAMMAMIENILNRRNPKLFELDCNTYQPEFERGVVLRFAYLPSKHGILKKIKNNTPTPNEHAPLIYFTSSYLLD